MDYSSVETEYHQLKTQFAAGQLSEVELKARLQDLMFEDEQGNWWMIGYETGQWYAHDGEKWVQAEPPGSAPSPISQPPVTVADRVETIASQTAVTQPVASEVPAAAATAHPARLMGMSGRALALIAVAWGACFWFWRFLDENVGIYGSTRVLIPGAWFLAGLATGVAVRLVEPTVRWRHILIGASVWGLCGLLTLPDVSETAPSVVRFAVVGLAGGLAMGLMVKQALTPVHWYHVLTIAAGWVIAFAVLSELAQIIVNEFDYNFDAGVVVIAGALVGVLGGGVAVWQIRRVQRSIARGE